MKPLLLISTVIAAVASSTVPSDDLIFRALTDEVNRSVKRLQLEKHKTPYYLSYIIRDTDTYNVAASFGAIVDDNCEHARDLACDVRVGSYKLDNTSMWRDRSLYRTPVSVDNDYDAIRRACWLRTENEYKRAIEAFESAKSKLQHKNVADRPDDWSHEQPVVLVEQPVKLQIDKEKWKNIVTKLSKIFRKYPLIQKSVVSFGAASYNRWLVNNEGFRVRTGCLTFGLVAAATAQADDGMKLTDYELVLADNEPGFDNEDDLEKKINGLAQRLSDLAVAPLAEEYSGPVLFEGPAAARFCQNALAITLCARREPDASFIPYWNSPLQRKLGQRILPKFITIIDDPLTKTYKGMRVLADYDVDDEGVKAQKITLVDNGILKTMCMSRWPTRAIQHSNGHAEDGFGEASNFFVLSKNELNSKKLRAKLMSLGKEEGLKYVFIARRLANIMPEWLLPRWLWSDVDTLSSQGGDVVIHAPTFLYRLDLETGKEQLVRGAQFTHVTPRILKDIEATGNDTRSYLCYNWQNNMIDVITPSILVREIDIVAPTKENDKLPVLKDPHYEETK